MGMMNMGGSLRYDYTGRKRRAYKKNNPTRKTKIQDSGKPLHVDNSRLEEMNEHRRKYPSLNSFGQTSGTKDDKWIREKQEISQGYTVAPAYNKGAYQVIGKSNIKDIGK
jgi:hypothetical protein|tara:strand:- start:418 stop:747 length:330 start_codon:yes stop_codon:yes gene_type:complete